MANWLKRGSKRTPFKGHKNFTQDAAQKRINEAVDSMHRKNENALQIDSHEVLIFKQTKLGLGRTCTCSGGHIEPEVMDAFDILDSDEVEIKEPEMKIAPENSNMGGIQIKLRKDNPFGDENAASESIHDGDKPSKVIELGDIGVKKDPYLDKATIDGLDPELQIHYRDNFLSGNSVSCGICYRRGKQPSYECHDHHYEVKTTYDINSMRGYHIDETAMPSSFNKVADEGYVHFEVDVPKFFKNLNYSVRNNEDVLMFEHIYDIETNEPVLKNDLEKFRGKQYKFKVLARHFTHVSIIFDLDMQPIFGNISEEGNRIDPDTGDTTGSLTVILPARAGSIVAGDILYLPRRRLTLKVLDAPRKRTANDVVIEWVLSTRTVQKHESIKNIAKGYKAG